MGPQLFAFLLLCTTAYASVIFKPDAFDLVAKGLTEFMNTGQHPGYLDYALENYPLPHVLRSDADTFNNTEVCLLCELLVNALILERRKGMSEVQLWAEASYFCAMAKIENQRVCDGVVEPVAQIFAYIVDQNPRLTGERICALLLQDKECRGNHLFEWSIDIPEGKTVDRKKSDGTKSFNILHISDIHYDPYYTPGKTTNCGEPVCCQSDQADATDETDTCGYWGAYNQSDSPIQAVHETMKQTGKHEFDFVYYTGDIVSHRVWSTSVANNTRDITLISDIFHEYFNVPVYSALGNHEPHPVNAFSSTGESDINISSQWLFELIADQWGDWITEDAKKTILKGGYYTIVPKKGFRVIVLNSNVCSTENWWLVDDDKDPYDQLAWLVETLTAAEKNDESVHILMHVPTGNSACLKVWSREFNKIIERFANTIVGHFNGHTHKDELTLYFSSSDPSEPINVAWNGASITTFTLSNPSYKVLQIDQETFDILDFEEWTFNLTKANLDPKKDVDWYKLYSFKDAYGVESLEPSEVNKLINNMAKDHSLIEQFYVYKYRNSDYVENNPCDANCQKQILCGITRTVHGDNTQCERLSKLYDENN